MPDGVVLFAGRYRLHGAGPLRLVLVRTPYGKRELDAKGTARVPGRRGMRVIVQNVRGAFGCGGRFAAFQQEREDGLSAGAWLPRAGVVRRALCDGRGATVEVRRAAGDGRGPVTWIHARGGRSGRTSIRSWRRCA
ncbi:CocE/NonD family hydrolase [Nonomuraea sp. NPDC049625]|uniref:CocE/NonD family hydrolase n=1 Tax=Nonomuraea sp. NPDC049625 TaxID=3155775 RepID=UPI003426A11E